MTPTRRIQLAAERQPVVVVVLGVIVFSVGPVMVAGTDISGAALSFWRLWIGVVVLGAITLVYVRSSGRVPDRRGWRWAAVCGLLFAGHQVAFMTALKRTSVVDVTLMQVLQPLVVAVLAAPLFGERPGSRFRLWSLVAMAGTVVVVLGGASGPDGDPGGMALAIVNILFFSLYFVGSKQSRDLIDVIPFLWGMTVVAALGVSVYAVIAGVDLGAAGRADLLAAAGIAVLPGMVGHFLSTWPLRWVPANIPPLLQLAIPFLAGSMAWVLLDEGITALHLVGGALTMAGAAGALRTPSGRRMVVVEDATLATGAG